MNENRRVHVQSPFTQASWNYAPKRQYHSPITNQTWNMDRMSSSRAYQPWQRECGPFQLLLVHFRGHMQMHQNVNNASLYSLLSSVSSENFFSLTIAQIIYLACSSAVSMITDPLWTASTLPLLDKRISLVVTQVIRRPGCVSPRLISSKV